MLQQHEKCSMRSKLMREGHRNKSANIRIYFPGTVADRVMRAYLYDPEPGCMPSMVRDILEREEKDAETNGDGVVKWKHDGDKEEVIDLVTETVVKLEPLLQKMVLPFEYQVSRRFKAKLWIPNPEGERALIELRGETDLVVRDNKGQWAIWDLKTTRDDSYWRKTIAQLTFYDLAHAAEFKERPKAVGLIQPLCKQQVIIQQVSNQQRAEMVQRIISYAHSVWKREFDIRKDMKECTLCPVRRSCEKWKPVNPGEANQSLGGLL